MQPGGSRGAPAVRGGALLLTGRQLAACTAALLALALAGGAAVASAERGAAQRRAVAAAERREALVGSVTAALGPSPDARVLAALDELQSLPPVGAAPTWSLGQSAYFMLQTVTTVGYGDVVPVTGPGRALTVLMSLAGVPLAVLVSLASGELITRRIAAVATATYETRRLAVSGHAPTRRSSALAAALASAGTLVCAFAFLLVLAGIIAGANGWAYQDSLYFVFVTLAGIGYGDLSLTNAHPAVAIVVLLVVSVCGFTTGSCLVGLLRGAVTGEWGQHAMLAADSASGGVALLPWEQTMLMGEEATGGCDHGDPGARPGGAGAYAPPSGAGLDADAAGEPHALPLALPLALGAPVDRP